MQGLSHNVISLFINQLEASMADIRERNLIDFARGKSFIVNRHKTIKLFSNVFVWNIFRHYKHFSLIRRFTVIFLCSWYPRLDKTLDFNVGHYGNMFVRSVSLL